MTINSGVLAYIKAFQQRADNDSIHNHVHHSAAANEQLKETLGDLCGFISTLPDCSW